MEPSLQNFLMIVPLVGFAVQRALTMVDPFVDAALTAIYKIKPNAVTPQSDAKAIVMGVASLILGYLAATYSGIPLPFGRANIYLATLIFSAGTEGANSIQKFLQNVKDNSKADNTAAVVLTPSTMTMKGGTSMRFQVQDPTLLNWAILESGFSDAIDQQGNFHAPPTVGIYHVVAKLKTDQTVTSVAVITVN